MSYENTVKVLNTYLDTFGPMNGITSILDCDYDHEEFTVVYLTSGYKDYIREFDGKIFVLADSDDWCDEFGESDGWTYAVFNSIEDYINCEFDGSGQPVMSDFGYSSFDSCFKSAVFDTLQHNYMFNR